MSNKKVHHEEHADETWLLPYSDLLTLLLALFIVMFAMSNLDKEKFEKISQEFDTILGGGSGLMERGGNSAGVMPQISKHSVEEGKLNKIKDTIEKNINKDGYSDKIKVVLNKDGLEISIQEVALFNSGDAEVLDSFSPLLSQIAKLLNGLDNYITIAGHTDDIPIRNEKFRSNWDLSAMRAINVMNFLVEQGGISPERFSVQGYGQYSPKFSNSTAEGKAKNRRVEIFLIRKYPQPSKD
ncbi:MAG TPA: flagellar motor protein MotB [Bacillota bacterium]|nr:flagellar motor protein MotB [Bacillota bacterium]